MKIKLNDSFTITSDVNCYILNRNLINKKNNTSYLQPVAFYNSLDSLIKRLIEREIRTVKIDDLQALKEHVEDMTKNIIDVIKGQYV